jgi:hypothetical protein
MREATDLFITEDGDLVISDNDLKTVSGDSFREQSAINRIKSVKSDWFYDNVGADMEEILGEPNTREVAEIGKNKIISVLTEDNLFEIDEVFVKVVPIKKYSLLYMVAIKSNSGSPIAINVKLDLVRGVFIV